MVGTWLLIRELLPGSPWAALAAASVVGLNPQFLFTSASITNDTWPTATAVLTLWLAVRCVHRDERRWPGWIGIGVLAGLGALTKASELLVGLPLAFVILPYLWRLRWGRGLRLGLLAALGALLSGGFWYLRNLALYGSPMPMNAIMAVLPGVARTEAASAAEIWHQMPVVWRSYWGIYGYGILAQPWFHQVTGWMTAISACGLLLFLLWRRRTSDAGTQTAVFLSILWFGAVFVSAVSYMRIVRYADQGRLLFSASPAIALLLVVGWQSILPRTLAARLQRLIPVAFVALAISQVGILREGYRIPPAVQAAQAARPINAEFAGGMNLVGVDLPLGAGVDAWGGLPITLYLQARQEISDYYTLFMHLTDDQGQVLWQFDGVPSEGRHPTRQWLPGQVFADSHVIRVGEIPADGPATLSIGFYPYLDPTQRQPLVNPGQNADRVVIKVRLHAGPAQAEPQTPAPLAAWSNGIRLDTAKVDTGDAGVPRRVTLAWQSQTAVHVDYTVSLQVLDDQGNMLAQVDQQPAAGEYPTSTWRAGDRITNTIELPEIAAPWRRVIVLLYDAAGHRLPLDGSAAAAASDYFVLASR